MRWPQTSAVWHPEDVPEVQVACMEEGYHLSLTSKELKNTLFALHTPTEAQYAKFEKYTLPELSEAVDDLNKLNESVHNGEYTWTFVDIQNAQAISKAMQKFLKTDLGVDKMWDAATGTWEYD